MSDLSLNILHLYPDLLNLYGDKGNIESLKKRLLWRGIGANINTCTEGNENIDFENTDIIFMGGGSDREQEIVLEKLLKYKEEFKKYVESGKSLVAACGGFYLLGKHFFLGDKKIEGLGILDITTEALSGKKRLIGNVVVKSDITDEHIVGFENHSVRVETGSYDTLGEVVYGFGNDMNSKKEGLLYKNVIGTNLHGPLLPKNPQLCDFILQNALKHKYSSFSALEKLDDSLENMANNYIVQAYTR